MKKVPFAAGQIGDVAVELLLAVPAVFVTLVMDLLVALEDGSAELLDAEEAPETRLTGVLESVQREKKSIIRGVALR